MLKAINMEVYIEKGFLNKFNKNYNNKPIQKIVKEIFILYGEKRVFLNYGVENFKELNDKNEIFALITSNIAAPTPVNSIKEHLFSKSDFNQTIVFTNKQEDWFLEAENKGALCFSLENFEERITELTDYAESLDIDIDEFEGWKMFEFMQKIPFNQITLCDNFVLADKKDGLIQKNIIPLLKELLKGKSDFTIPVKIFTKEFNLRYPITNDQLMNVVKQKFTTLNKSLANYSCKFKILNTKANNKVDIHGRELVTNFFIIRSGRGFNLIPKNSDSNEVITAGTIFNKKDYYRIKKRMRLYKNHENYLIELGNKNFQCYPEEI